MQSTRIQEFNFRFGRLTMRSTFLGNCAVTLLAGAHVCFSAGAFAVEKKPPAKADPSLAAVESALRAEVAGQVNRRERLAEALEGKSDAPAARWQAGFVRD